MFQTTMLPSLNTGGVVRGGQPQEHYQPEQQQYQGEPQQPPADAPGDDHISSGVGQQREAAPGGTPVCENCGRHITGVFCRAGEKNLHAECFNCSTCGTSLKNTGFFNMGGKLYCEIHARQRSGNLFKATPPLDPSNFAPRAPPLQQPKISAEPVKAFYQPDILKPGPVSPGSVPLPRATQSPMLSPSSRGVPTRPHMYTSSGLNQELNTANNVSSSYTSSYSSRTQTQQQSVGSGPAPFTPSAPVAAPIAPISAPAPAPVAAPPSAPAQAPFDTAQRMRNNGAENFSRTEISAENIALNKETLLPEENEAEVLNKLSEEEEIKAPPATPAEEEVEANYSNPTLPVPEPAPVPLPKTPSHETWHRVGPAGIELSNSTNKMAWPPSQKLERQVVPYWRLPSEKSEALFGGGCGDPWGMYERRLRTQDDDDYWRVVNYRSSDFISPKDLRPPSPLRDELRRCSSMRSSLPTHMRNRQGRAIQKTLRHSLHETTHKQEQVSMKDRPLMDTYPLMEKAKTLADTACIVAEEQIALETERLACGLFDERRTEDTYQAPSKQKIVPEQRIPEQQTKAKTPEPYQNGNMDATIKELMSLAGQLELSATPPLKPHLPVAYPNRWQPAEPQIQKTVTTQKVVEMYSPHGYRRANLADLRSFSEEAAEIELTTFDLPDRNPTPPPVKFMMESISSAASGSVMQPSGTESSGTYVLSQQQHKSFEGPADVVSTHVSARIEEERLSALAEELNKGSLLPNRVSTGTMTDFPLDTGTMTDYSFLDMSATPSTSLGDGASTEHLQSVLSSVRRFLHRLSCFGSSGGSKWTPTVGAGANRPAGASQPRRGKGVLKQLNEIPRIPICEACHKEIRGPFILAIGKTWCPDHFVCSNGTCGRKLLDVGFIEEGGQIYCEYCFEQYFAPQCGKCFRPVTGDCLNALNRQWHPECFTCSACNKPFGNASFFLEEGKAYCEQDWNQLFTTKCVSCKFPIEAGDRWVEALNNAYHSDCFTCTTCHKNLEGQSFYAKGGHPYCKAHA